MWNQLSGCSLPGAISWRTRSAKISAPPPGSEPRPASFSSRKTSSCEMPASFDVWVLAVDAVDLRELRDRVLLDRVLDELLRGDRVRVLLLARLCERTELALHAAHVRLVEVEVLDEVDLIAAAAHAAREIGELAEREQVVRLHQRHAVLEVEPRAGLDLVPDRGERLLDVEDCHLLLPVDDGVRQRLELVTVHFPVEARPRLPSVVEGNLAR